MADEPEDQDHNEEDGPPFPELFGDADEHSEEAARRQQSLEEREVEVVGLYEHRREGAGRPEAFVRLRDAHDSRGRSVFILIGQYEAYAIAIALEGVAGSNEGPPRPLTHDLLKTIMDKLGGRVEKILIDDLWNDTYYAKISITVDGKAVQVDSRPSDAIALALRAKAPIFMAEWVLEQAAVDEEY